MAEGPSGTVPVVDDQDDLRRLLVLALRRNNLDVFDAPTGEVAMEILDTADRRPDPGNSANTW